MATDCPRTVGAQEARCPLVSSFGGNDLIRLAPGEHTGNPARANLRCGFAWFVRAALLLRRPRSGSDLHVLLPNVLPESAPNIGLLRVHVLTTQGAHPQHTRGSLALQEIGPGLHTSSSQSAAIILAD